MCGLHFPITGLQIHHLQSVALHAEMIAWKSNIRLVCPECHIKIHKEINQKTDEVIRECNEKYFTRVSNINNQSKKIKL